jgi:signal transduction histidine kinase
MPLRRSLFLMAAFAALLGVSALAAWAVWRNAREAQAKVALLHERDLAAHRALGDVRADVYQTAILTRDYLLDAHPAKDDYFKQLAAIRQRIDANLKSLKPAGQDVEQQYTLDAMSTELQGYWETTEVMLHWTESERQQQRSEMLARRVGRRRDILALIERIEQLTAQRAALENTRIAEADQYFRMSLGWTASIALLLGIGISAFTLMRLRNLENQSEISESALRSLSGQLRTAQEQERKSLSRELHDQVGQMLTGLRMELTAIGRSKPDQAGERDESLQRAKQTVEHALSIVRNISMLLRPSMLDDLGLTPALAWLMKEMSRSTGIEIQQEVDPRLDSLPDAHRTCLYRVVQEALTNVTRHSGARTVHLKATTGGGLVHLTLTDDGKGFDMTANRGKGLGFLGMEERVRELGGQLHALSTPGRGTSIEIVLPQPASLDFKVRELPEHGFFGDRSPRPVFSSPAPQPSPERPAAQK